MGRKATADEASASDFSLVAGGPLYRLGLRVRLVSAERGTVEVGFALAFLTWVPLLVLVAVQGIAFQAPVVRFLHSLGTHVRFLVAIPLFFAAEAWVDPRVRNFVRQLVESRIVTTAELPSFDAAIREATRLRNSTVAELALLALAVATMAAGLRVDLPGQVSTWRTTGAATGPSLTPAGWWYTVVSLPLFQFLLWRWCWRLVIWSRFLWRLSRLDLQLVPTHPDLAGGLGFLAAAQTHFATLSFAASAVLSASFAEEIAFAGARVETFVLPVAGIVLVNLAVFLGPLLLFTPQLVAVKRRGLREYGVLAFAYTRGFDAKWVQGGAPREEPLLGTPDIQSLADLAGGFDTVRHMRVVPFGRALVRSLVAAAVTPMLPLLLLRFPLDELLVKGLKLLLGI